MLGLGELSMSQAFRLIAVVGLTVGLAACASPARPLCAPEVGSPLVVFTLYLGRAIPGRVDLTDKEWQSFLDATVTPGLPNGYTILDANGAWMNPVTRKTIKEASKILVAALPDAPDSLVKINRIRTAYQLEFHQQLVGMTVAPGCGTF
jgi:hypothetical protein